MKNASKETNWVAILMSKTRDKVARIRAGAAEVTRDTKLAPGDLLIDQMWMKERGSNESGVWPEPLEGWNCH